MYSWTKSVNYRCLIEKSREPGYCNSGRGGSISCLCRGCRKGEALKPGVQSHPRLLSGYLFEVQVAVCNLGLIGVSPWAMSLALTETLNFQTVSQTNPKSNVLNYGRLSGTQVIRFGCGWSSSLIVAWVFGDRSEHNARLVGSHATPRPSPRPILH